MLELQPVTEGPHSAFFSPLTLEEMRRKIERGCEPGNASDEGWRPLPVVPPDAPTPDFAHPAYDDPVSTWCYRGEPIPLKNSEVAAQPSR
jgi:hypothetical protein